MSYLIIGDKGMLARAVKDALRSRGESFTGVDLPDFDLTRNEHVDAAVQPGLKAVLNCSAYTNVDGAEAEEELATRINGKGVELLAKACARANVPLVHYSTDYVFAGHASEPYPIDGAYDPINAYGRSKAVGEAAIREAGGPFLILRTSWLYAPWGNNFVRTIFKASLARPTLRVVNDQRGRPTSAEHLAKVTFALLDAQAHGILHVTDGGECSWFDFASEIVRLSGHACSVEPCTSEEFVRPAKRPPYSVLDLGPTEKLVGPMQDWHANLADVMARLEPVT